MRNREPNARDVFELRTATATGFETKGDVTGHRPQVTDVKAEVMPSEVETAEKRDEISRLYEH